MCLAGVPDKVQLASRLDQERPNKERQTMIRGSASYLINITL